MPHQLLRSNVRNRDAGHDGKWKGSGIRVKQKNSKASLSSHGLSLHFYHWDEPGTVTMTTFLFIYFTGRYGGRKGFGGEKVTEVCDTLRTGS